MQLQSHYNRFLLSLEGTKTYTFRFADYMSGRMVAIFCMILTNCYISKILTQNFSKSFFIT